MKRLLIAAVLALLAARANAAISFVVASTAPAVQSSATQDVNINVPAGLAVGDLMLVQIAVRGGSSATFSTVPTGWTLARRTNSTTTLGHMAYYKFAQAGDLSTQEFLWKLQGQQRAVIAMTVWRGVDPTSPIEASAGQANASSASIVAPAVTTAGASRVVVRLFATANGNGSITVPGGVTQRHATRGTNAGGNGVAIIAGSADQAAAGSSGTATATASNAAVNVGLTLALVPAGGLTAAIVAEYEFDEASWSGAAGEITDSEGGYDARARNSATTAGVSPAVSGSPGTCRYGSFNGTTQYVELPATLPRAGNQFTITAWIRTTHDWSTQKDQRIWVDDEFDNGYALSLGDGGARKLRFFARSPSLAVLDSSAVVEAGQWYFVAAVMDASGSQTMKLYVYNAAGTLLDQQSVARSSFTPGTGKVAIGGEVDGAGEGVPQWRFLGNIDEVRFHAGALSAPQIVALLNTTHPCAAGATALRISHSATGLYCVDQAVTVTTIDGNGNAATGYTGTVNLSTTTGKGTWLASTGSGTLSDPTSDDGAASYAWNASDSSVQLLLRYRTGAAITTVDAVDSLNATIVDDGTQGTITFAPSGFTVTSQALGNPPPGSIPAFDSPQVAGNNFSVHITAYGQTPTDPVCGVIEGYTGAKSLKFWSSYANPATGTVQASIDGSAIATSEGASAAQAVTFASGQAVVTARYRDAGSLSLSMKDDTTGNPGLPNGIRGGTGTFVSRPADFVVSGIRRTSDNFANPAASTASGAVFIAAGRPFTATVTAVDSAGNTTPNFGRESPAETVKFSVALVLPASGNAPAVSGTAGTFTNGVATGTAFAWPEVGIVRLVPRVSDADYLGAGDVVGTQTGNVGRFIPDSFGVALNTPVFATACAAGAYTYVGQPFTYTVAPVLTATARAFGGTTTQNYTGSLFRLTNASLTGRTYAAASGTLDTSGLPATSADPAIVDTGGGIATLTYSAGSGLAFSRTSAVAPFDASITLAQNVLDLDGAAASNPVTFGGGAGISFSTGATQRYGRLALRNALGSELLDLPMSLVTQYYVSAAIGFTTHTGDSCTAAPAIALSGYQGSLAAGETCVRDTGAPGVSAAGCAAPASVGLRYRATPLAGNFNLNLAAPGAGNSGAAVVTATAPAWLRYDWNSATPGTEQPSALATFGLFPGPASRIYQREIY
jgi:MSHA biogenesis protein MshQ